MLAGSLCTDSVDQANAIDAHFNDVNAFIRSVKPPVYPFPVNSALAERGACRVRRSLAPRATGHTRRTRSRTPTSSFLTTRS